MTKITIWPFYDAPLEFQECSIHGGDEDFVAILEGNVDELPWRLQDVFSLMRSDGIHRDYVNGWGHIQRVLLPNSHILVIAAHA